MKKILALLLSVCIVIGCCTGCSMRDIGDFFYSLSSEETQEPTANKTEPAEPGTEATEPATEPATEAIEPATEAIEPATEATEPATEATEPATEATEPATEATEPATEPEVTGSVDVSNARVDTSKENPAKIGEWIKSTRYCSQTRVYETIYYRVTGVTTDCQEDIDRYNEGNNFYVFEELEDEDLAYHKVSYEVYFPEDYPQADWGISSMDISLSACSPTGGGIKWKGVAYIGLGTCYDIAPEQEIRSGDIYKGEALYVMVNDPSVEYIFYYQSYVPGGDTSGERLETYVASK